MARGFLLINTLKSSWNSILAALAWLVYTLLGVKLLVGEKAPLPPLQQPKSVIGAGMKKGGESPKGLREKEEFERKYDLKEDLELGEGGFARVCVATSRLDDEDYAVKIISRKNLTSDAAIEREIEIMKKAQHPNIIQFHDMYKLDDKMYIVMELVRGGELFDRICEKPQYGEGEAATCAQEMLSALQYLHSLGIVHRDIKPQNVLYASPDDNAPIKLADFGLSAMFDSAADLTMKTVCGTLGFAAPEVMQDQPEARGYDAKCDIWSTGVILYMLLCGEPPFDFGSPLLIQEVKRGFPHKPEVWAGVSEDAQELVRSMMQLDPARRPSAAACRAHAWFPLSSTRKISNSSDSLSSTHQRLKVWHAGQRLRQTIHSVKTLDTIASRRNWKPPSWRSARPAIEKIKQDPKQLEELRSAFDLLDRDQTGRISADNLASLFQGMGGEVVPSRGEVEAMVGRFDLVGDGGVGFDQFLALLAPKPREPAAQDPARPHSPPDLQRLRSDELHMRAAFDFFDADSTGFITTEELHAAFMKLGLPHTEEELRHMVEACDLNGDGMISFEEFCRLTTRRSSSNFDSKLRLMSDFSLSPCPVSEAGEIEVLNEQLDQSQR